MSGSSRQKFNWISNQAEKWAHWLQLLPTSHRLLSTNCCLRIVAYGSLRMVAYETLPLVSYQSLYTSCLAALDQPASVCFPNDFIYLPLNHSLSVRLIQRLKFNGSQVIAAASQQHNKFEKWKTVGATTNQINRKPGEMKRLQTSWTGIQTERGDEPVRELEHHL